MPGKKKGTGIKVLHVLEDLLFLGTHIKEHGRNNKKKTSPAAAKDRLLLKLERAEIMAAMISMRENQGQNPDGLK